MATDKPLSGVDSYSVGPDKEIGMHLTTEKVTHATRSALYSWLRMVERRQQRRQRFWDLAAQGGDRPLQPPVNNDV